MDKANGLRPQKPDLVAVHGKSDSGRQYSWNEIHVGVEVKSVWSVALKQAATYGRSMLEQGKRWYSVVIIYNHAEETVRFTFYNRCG
ncbi:hypothetical protein JB92DRAFT_2725846, partial [Gautieria morchelliformis]